MKISIHKSNKTFEISLKRCLCRTKISNFSNSYSFCRIPPTIEKGSISFVTTAPAATIDPSPIVQFGNITC